MALPATLTPVTFPHIGSKLILADPWKFTLHSERRNKTFWIDLFGDPCKDRNDAWTFWRGGTTQPVILPTGSILKVDRIYVRRGAKDFDTITFLLEHTSMPEFAYTKRKVKGRFWVKLGEVNTMIATWDETTVARG